jgi:hypothetical protein
MRWIMLALSAAGNAEVCDQAADVAAEQRVRHHPHDRVAHAPTS